MTNIPDLFTELQQKERTIHIKDVTIDKMYNYYSKQLKDSDLTIETTEEIEDMLKGSRAFGNEPKVYNMTEFIDEITKTGIYTSIESSEKDTSISQMIQYNHVESFYIFEEMQDDHIESLHMTNFIVRHNSSGKYITVAVYWLYKIYLSEGNMDDYYRYSVTLNISFVE